VAVTAFDAFYRANYERVLTFAIRRVADLETAKEVTAECFVVAWRKYDENEPFSVAWLYLTARNLIGNAYQRRDRERRLMEALEVRASRAQEEHDLSDVRHALMTLTELDREALLLTYWERLSAAEAAVVMGCSEQAAWKRISRARTAVRTALIRAKSEEAST
jgi:RNA polymerase sigma factor (sigma-70 family)